MVHVCLPWSSVIFDLYLNQQPSNFPSPYQSKSCINKKKIMQILFVSLFTPTHFLQHAPHVQRTQLKKERLAKKTNKQPPSFSQTHQLQKEKREKIQHPFHSLLWLPLCYFPSLPLSPCRVWNTPCFVLLLCTLKVKLC